MKDLSPEAKAILDLGATADEPTFADRERVRRAVAARVGVGIAAGAAVGTAATKVAAGTGSTAATAATGAAGASAAAGTGTVVAAAGAKVALTSVAAKVLVGVALATGGGAVIYQQARAPKVIATSTPTSTPTSTSTSTPTSTSTSTSTPTSTSTSTSTPTSTSTSPSPSPVDPPANANPAPVEAPAPRIVATATARASAPVVVPAPAPASTLAAEARLLSEANEAIQKGQASVALDRLDEHERTYPAGVLSEERSATRVLALCAAGRDGEARTLASSFLARFPRSPYVPRIESSCAGTPARP